MRKDKKVFKTTRLLPPFTQQLKMDFIQDLKMCRGAINLPKKLGQGENLIILLGVSGAGRDTVLEECLTLSDKSKRIKKLR